MRRRIVLVGILWAVGIGVSGAWAREWGDATGKYKIEATFVDFRDGQVWLKRQKDGKVIPVPMAQLRLQDQQYVVKLMMLPGKGGNAGEAQPAPASDATKNETATSSPAPSADPAAASAPGPEPMFKVVKSEIVTRSVEVNGCRVPLKPGLVLYVCTIDFTKAGLTLSAKELGEMKVASASKMLSRRSKQGNVISKGDFTLRLEDQTTVPCYCLPAGDSATGLPVRPPRARGADWLMYCGNVRLLAPVKPDAKPEALVWGTTYEAKVLPPGTEPAKEPATTAMAQATPASQPPSTAATPPRAAPGGAKTAAARASQQAARREQIARRTAVLNNGVLRDLLAKHPELASANIGPQLAIADDFWNDKDEFKSAAFEEFIKRVMGR
jgi:hypothetical protein